MSALLPVDIGDDDPVTLEEACRRFFHGAISPATLRAERDRGRLVVERVGRRDFVTARAIREMRRLCRVQPSPSDSGSSPNAVTPPAASSSAQHGASSTEDGRLARAALQATAARLKKRSNATSSNAGKSRASAIVTPLRSG